MTEPDWKRLPFATSSSDWRAYAEVPDARAAAALIRGEAPPVPAVWLHHDAVAAFAAAAWLAEGEAFLEMGAGVLRFARAGLLEIGDGQCDGDFRFRGAPDLRLCLGCVGGALLVYVPRLA